MFEFPGPRRRASAPGSKSVEPVRLPTTTTPPAASVVTAVTAGPAVESCVARTQTRSPAAESFHAKASTAVATTDVTPGPGPNSAVPEKRPTTTALPPASMARPRGCRNAPAVSVAVRAQTNAPAAVSRQANTVPFRATRPGPGSKSAGPVNSPATTTSPLAGSRATAVPELPFGPVPGTVRTQTSAPAGVYLATNVFWPAVVLTVRTPGPGSKSKLPEKAPAT